MEAILRLSERSSIGIEGSIRWALTLTLTDWNLETAPWGVGFGKGRLDLGDRPEVELEALDGEVMELTAEVKHTMLAMRTEEERGEDEGFGGGHRLGV